MTPFKEKHNSQSLLVSCGDLAGRLGYRSIKEPIDAKVRRTMLLLLVAIVLAGLSMSARSQSPINSENSSGTGASTTALQLDLTYPNRYGAMDAFRIYNYSMLAYVGENISLECIYSGFHSLLHRMHLNNAHGSPDKGPNK